MSQYSVVPPSYSASHQTLVKSASGSYQQHCAAAKVYHPTLPEHQMNSVNISLHTDQYMCLQCNVAC